MEDKLDILSIIAERKILEAIEQGQFDNLPGAGKPLPDDDLANLPDDLRLAWRILRSADYNNQSLESGQVKSAADLYAQAPDEGQASRRLTSLKLKLEKKAKNNKPVSGRPVDPLEASSDRPDILDSQYLDKILQKIR
ncbi:MAG: DUF1992 domain-containing protein [Deltaproteobacteria bacterium]|jgi:hypothetical protein|nr:DUF1992 domain-containing protein [Deltaproteobacteria bacterium]